MQFYSLRPNKGVRFFLRVISFNRKANGLSVSIVKYTKTYAACSLIGLALSLLIPSSGVAQKYFGLWGTSVYIVTSVVILLAACSYVIPTVMSVMNEKRALSLAALTILTLVIVHLVLYPIANSGVIGGGTDTDEALNVAASKLLHGRYPYYAQTYTGNPIAPLPGAVILSIPFVLLGNSAYQNLFWLAVFFLVIRRFLSDTSSALLLFWVILILSPIVMNHVVTGNDELSNSIYIIVFILLMVSSIPRAGVATWRMAITSILFGIGLSSRANFLLLVPLVFSLLVRKAGWKDAMKYISVSCLAFAATTLPFWIYDPQSFSALYVQYSKVAQFEGILPWSGLIIPLAGGVIAVLLSFNRVNSSTQMLLRNCALVQAFPVLCTIVLTSAESKSVNLTGAHYGIFFLFSGCLSGWATLVNEATIGSVGNDQRRARLP